jgi:predicted nucleic-acid-binding Zn-ribbon protein
VPLSSKQRQALERWIHSKGVAQCTVCGESRWRFSEAAYIRGLLEHGEPDLAEDKGVVKILCENCGYVMLFDAETVGIRAMWDSQRGI